MQRELDLERLKDFFPPEDLEFKPVAVSKKTNKALVAAYVTNRAVMDRLDEVCGPANWQNSFTHGPDGGVVCGLSIRIGDEWVTKWDGAENTDIEPVKGGLSTSMRRAAVQWGVGRYLYDLPQQWVDADERGRLLREPQLPAKFLPPAQKDAPSKGELTDQLYRPANGHTPEPITEAQWDFAEKLLRSHVWTNDERAGYLKKARRWTKDQASSYIDRIQAELERRKEEEKRQAEYEAVDWQEDAPFAEDSDEATY